MRVANVQIILVMMILYFTSLFNIIELVPRWWKGNNESLCAITVIPPPAKFELGTRDPNSGALATRQPRYFCGSACAFVQCIMLEATAASATSTTTAVEVFVAV